MNAFLNEARIAYQNVLLNPTFYNRLRVVLSNETCDLDSATCALVYGFVLHHEGIQESHSKTAVLPLLNVPHDDLVLKTEVTYFLEANGIVLDNVPTRGFRDLLDLNKIHKAGVLEVTLVDHHHLAACDEALQSAVVEVIDHRPQNPRWLWSEISNVTIQSVGSCSTLIANKIKDRAPHLMTREIAKLLLGPILLDTVCLSPEAVRATAKDQEMVQYLESVVTVDRQQMHDALVNAKADIARLTTSQVLRKDLKIIGGIPMPGVPILINELRKRSDFEETLIHFIRLNNNVPVIVLMGVNVAGKTVQRDLAIFGKTPVVDPILETLLSTTEPHLDLIEITDHGITPLRLFRQGNLKATRKAIGPIIAKVAEDLEEIQKCGLG